MGKKHPDYAHSLNNLAVVYLAEGNYAKAEPLFVEALAIDKQVLGEKHPDYAISLNNLAGCEIGLRSYTAAAGHAQLAAEYHAAAARANRRDPIGTPTTADGGPRAVCFQHFSVGKPGGQHAARKRSTTKCWRGKAP